MTARPEEALETLFLSMYSADELRRLIWRLPGGDQLSLALPGGSTSPAALAHDAVGVLVRKRLVNADLFNAMRAERGGRGAEINAVEKAFAAPAAATTTASDAPQLTTTTATRGGLDFAVFTALPLETSAVIELLGATDDRILPDTGTLLEEGTLQGRYGMRTVAVAEAGKGNIAAARLAQEVYAALRPKAAIFVGIAGGVKDVSLGDVVVATKIYGYESGKDGKAFQTRPELGEASYRLLQRARADARRTAWLGRAKGIEVERSPVVHVGAIAAGEKVVSSTRSASYQLIKANYGDSLAVEMEGYGFLQALLPYKAEALVVRGISDLIDKKSHADAGGWQPRAARAAAAFAFEVMANLEG